MHTHTGPYHAGVGSNDVHVHSDPLTIHIQPPSRSDYAKSRADTSAAVPSTTSTLSISPSSSLKRFRPTAPTNIHLPTHRMRSSFSTSSAPMSSPGGSSGVSSSGHPNGEMQTTVATLRWAAARVDISPLALPSPEHELTDPMRGVMATVPGSHPSSDDLGYDYPATPGGTRKPRLPSFWHGTTDVYKDVLPSSDPGPTTTSDTLDVSTDVHNQLKSRPASLPASFASPPRIPPASAPMPDAYHSNELTPIDYFGSSPPIDPSSPRVPTQVLAPVVPGVTHLQSQGKVVMTVPALPRRVCLTRQTSSPLPVSAPFEPRDSRVPSETIANIKMGRAAKEEQMFAELEYLAPPNPPDELERRRALYKCVSAALAYPLADIFTPSSRMVHFVRCDTDSTYGTPAQTSTSTGLHTLRNSCSAQKVS